MDSILQVLGTISFALAISVLIGFAFGTWRRQRQFSSQISPSAAARIKTPNQIYRARLANSSGDELWFEAPLSRDTFVPLTVGESATIELPVASGVLRFTGTVESRDEANHRFLVRRPRGAAVVDRRESHRNCFSSPPQVKIEGAPGTMIDLSERGARIKSVLEISKGERVTLSGDVLDGTFPAWIIDAKPIGSGAEASNEYRLIFEELLST